MFALNGLLLVALGFAVRRAFGPGVAVGTIAFLAVDPTVAAHLPVVMTDLRFLSCVPPPYCSRSLHTGIGNGRILQHAP
jgi:hypothetical protein